MAERLQLTALVSKLADLAGLLNPARLTSVVADVVREVRVPPPGDPAALLALADSYRGTAAALTDAVGEVSAQGEIAGAVAVARRVAESFTLAAETITEHAEAVRGHQERHAALHRALEDAAHDATHVGSVPMPDPVAIVRLVGAVGELIRGCVEVYTDSIVAADRAASRFTDLRGTVRVAAAVASGLAPRDALVLADRDPGELGVRFDTGVLGLGQFARLRGLSRTKADGLLAAAGSDTERAWLIKAIAADHTIDTLREFADEIRGRDPRWLDEHLSLVDRGSAAAQSRMGTAVRQYEATTCGTTTLIVARAEHDPLYALALTRGDFQSAFAAERAAVHDETNVIYPQAAGTSPKGVAAYLTRHIGVPYRWRLVDDTDRREISRTLREVVGAVDHGVPVPLLVGGIVPRHYVLVVGHERGTLLVFEPTAGRTVAIPEHDVLSGDLAAALGFDHVQSVILPTR